ncbi:hypothetical protein PWT90_11008 [Aphanocladium album]|nr:hypothetical protein PWT90_11008 [Aphanocladium album]
MHFTTIAAVATMAAVAAAEPQPYRLATMPGLSLMRRASDGYVPETTKCGAGNTCAEACGAEFAECPSKDGVSHCFNPAAKQSCCQDGSGNSCDAGYYCTHDHKAQTWCCPEGMDLAACAAAYSVTGGLEKATPTPTPTPTPSPAKHNTTTKAIVTETLDMTTTICPSGTGKPVYPGTNTTISVPVVPVPTGSHTGPAVVPTGTNAAAATSFSALLLVAAGAIALL